MLAGLGGTGALLAGGLWLRLRRRRAAQFRLRRPGRTITVPSEPALATVEKTLRHQGDITSDLVELPIELVIARGEVWADGGKLVRDIEPYAYPAFAKGTVKVGRTVTAADFAIRAPSGKNAVTARVIGIIENKTNTQALERTLAVEDGLVNADRAQDVAQVAVIERHKGTGRVVNGFVSGFRYDVDCGVAATVAHDSHHMIVVGTNHDDMALAANRLQQVGGGFVVVSRGQELALVELPIAGLMSDERAEVVAKSPSSSSWPWRSAAAPSTMQ